MARIRSVHPALFTDEAWVSCSPLARILYVGLWTDADDQGLFEWKPLQIKMRLLPGDTADVPAMLAELVEAGLIRTYRVAEKTYGAIRNFRKFQRPQKPNAVHPLGDGIASYVGLSETDPAPVADHSDTAPVIPQQMEDVGEEEEEEVTEPTVPCPAAPNAAPKVDWFERAWRLYPALGCQRSKSKKLTAPIWRKAAKEAGGDERLHDAVARYVREDKQHKGECGPPGFHRWLNDGKWSHWLPEARAPSASGADPSLLALHQRLMNGTAANA